MVYPALIKNTAYKKLVVIKAPIRACPEYSGGWGKKNHP
jgi:hypothetical protein